MRRCAWSAMTGLSGRPNSPDDANQNTSNCCMIEQSLFGLLCNHGAVMTWGRSPVDCTTAQFYVVSPGDRCRTGCSSLRLALGDRADVYSCWDSC